MNEQKTLEQWTEDAMQIINFLAPVTRRDEWWASEWCLSGLADELKRMYGVREDLTDDVEAKGP